MSARDILFPASVLDSIGWPWYRFAGHATLCRS